MKIEIWSDVMCPFCYIGKKNFETALEQIPYKDKIQVIWKSYQLDSDLSKTEPADAKEYFDKKGYSLEQVAASKVRLNEMGAPYGVTFNEGNIMINTGDAHRVIQFAQTKGLASVAEEALFKAYFTDNKNVADHDTLAEIAVEIGLNKTETLEMLNSDSFVFDVASDVLDARNIGVTGVPFFVVDRKYALSGAQPVEYFVSALTQAYEKDHLDASSNDGATCDVDGNNC
ncbi:DsbA family oxidoreductase [Faecalibacter macacae]|uniref:DsbA family oxidoreductase n=1 Tax=Faecalibacter macacae TaxID=1859289 RepID=A0A3L9MES9_9FLAO|nr:DsbA family oxidoreductase [Faecalibacter macacae]RLZ11398.1 DsbA family oxidoreductase [Faecalibacter macacae]